MILEIFVGILGFLLGALMIALVRTLFTKAPKPQPCTTQITQPELDTAEQKLGAMVRVPTVSKSEEEDLSEFYKFHKVLEDCFPLIHKHLEKIELQGTLLFHWEGADPFEKPILLMGHQDVVPATDEGWTVPPYSGTVVDGNLYGRGSIDCKSTMYVELQAVEELLVEGFTPPVDVYLGYSINEETSGRGATFIAKYFSDQGIELGMALDEGGAIMDRAVPGMDRPYAVIGITEKGYMDVKITARGKGGHSSTPPRNTPTARLFAFANDIERKRPFRRDLMPEAEVMFQKMAPSFSYPLRLLLGNIWFFRPLLMRLMPMVSPFGEAVMATTCCFTMMEGSEAPNVIPKEPYLIANLRVSAHQNCKKTMKILNRYAKKHGVELEVLTDRDASPISNITSGKYKYLTKCIQSNFPDVGVAPFVIMGGTDCRYFHMFTENALRFCPVRMTAAQSASCHAVDENVTVSALAEGVRFMKDFLQNYPA